MSNYNKNISKRIGRFTDDELIEMITIKFNDYTEEALNTAKEVASKRGLSKMIKDKEQSIEQDKIQKEKEIIRQHNVKKENGVLKIMFIYVPTTGRIIFLVFLSVLALSYNPNYESNHPQSIFGSFLLIYFFWAHAFRFFPWKKKGLIIEANKIVFGIKEDKNTEVIDKIKSIKLSQDNTTITITGLKNGKYVTRNIERKNIKKTDFELIKVILKDKIES